MDFEHQQRGQGLFAESLESVARRRNLPFNPGNVDVNLAIMAGERLGTHLSAAQQGEARWRTAAIVVGLFGLVSWVRSFLPASKLNHGRNQ